jgi:hypothetical protein
MLCTLLVACSTLDVPRAMNYPASGQQKARAVHHWDLLANDVAERIATKTAAGAMEKNTFHLVPSTGSTFNRAFGDLLLTRLVERGLVVASSPAQDNSADAYIRFDVQVVSHESGARNAPAMPLTSLAAGVAVLRDSWMHIPSSASGALAVQPDDVGHRIWRSHPHRAAGVHLAGNGAPLCHPHVGHLLHRA